MEKRRRARINHCLNELKSLILEAMKKDVSILSMSQRIRGVAARDLETRPPIHISSLSL